MRAVAAAATQPLLILRTLLPTPFSKPASSSLSTHQNPLPPQPSLSPQQLTQINLLIPRLCQRPDHLPHVARLLDSILLLPNPPPLTSLSLPILIHSLTSSSDISLSMSLLTRLGRNPRAGPHLLPIAHLLLASYLRARKPRDAMSIFRWMSRPENSQWGKVNGSTYGMAVTGFCRNGRTLEALKVLRGMVSAGVAPEEDVRGWVYRSLLREARVKEAVELDGALGRVREGGKGGDRDAAVELMDQMVRDWRE
ncbi:uncharacterized protein LOC131241371 [Magnolia sinica]|uniref:uncharacterized protein LOC131241371 n=1 Tax=Magnolia sinica TaxID=86752 RepID=UPI0026592950|nr:uncharacterized protein LOC131241371 [Magnolia sinica]XP_058096180.1 uncharacterized protein LOC131241371 [Magnolia sinica]